MEESIKDYRLPLMAGPAFGQCTLTRRNNMEDVS